MLRWANRELSRAWETWTGLVSNETKNEIINFKAQQASKHMGQTKVIRAFRFWNAFVRPLPCILLLNAKHTLPFV